MSMREVFRPFRPFRSQLWQGGAFSPASLFAGGRSGFLIGGAPAFTDVHATDLADTANDGIGFATDTHAGLGYSGGAFTGTGAQMIANGTNPVNTTGWACLDAAEVNRASRLTASGGVFTVNVSSDLGYTFLYALMSGASAGSQVRLAVELTARTANRVYFATSTAQTSESGLTALSPGSGDTALRTYQFVVDAAATTYFRMAVDGVSGGALSFNNVSGRVLPGFSARQGTGSFQPKYQIGPARYVFDGIDDRLTTARTPTPIGSLAVRMRSTTASRVAIGSQDGGGDRCYIALAADGALAGGIANRATDIIKGATDVRGQWVTGVLTWDDVTVRLYQDGAQVYSAAQVGSLDTAVPFSIGGLNNAGNHLAFHAGDIARALFIDRVLTPAEITNLHTTWSTIS